MNSTPIDWKRLFELLDEFFELEAPERQRWLENVADISAATKSQLLKLIAQRANLENSDFLRVPPAAPGAQPAPPQANGQRTPAAANGPFIELPPELSEALGQFIAGLKDANALHCEFRDYLASHEVDRPRVVRWLRQSAQSGRIPETVRACLNNLFVEPQVKPARARSKAARPASNFVLPHLRAAARRPAAANRDVAATAERPGAKSAAKIAPEAPKLCVGMVLKDHFTLIEELGHGGMGYVFKARDRWAEEAEDKNPFVAIKVLSEEFRRHPDADKALQWEAKRAHTLAHPNVITVYQFDRDGPYSYMTMEYLQGHPLDALLKSAYAAGVPLEKAWAIIRQICAALDYGHTKVYDNKKGIVHSDLKPGNVFVCDDGCVKLLDFGISRPMPAVGKDVLTSQFDPGKRLRALTPAYASLEMWSGDRPAPSDDIYALGCIVYELLTGRHPFLTTNPVTGEVLPCSAPDALRANMSPKRIDSLNRSQWDALRKTLVFRRAERTASVSEFVHCFEPKGFIRRHAVSLAAAVLVAAAGVVTTGAYSYRSYIEDDLLRPEPTRRHVAITPAQKEQVAEYLAQANEDYKDAMVKDAMGSLSPDQLTYLLSDGANNVYEIVGAALAIEPDNKSAEQMKSQIVNVYAQKARILLDAGKTARAMTFVRKGLMVKDTDRGLNHLYREICKKDLQVCSDVNVSP
jgi:serine/threonine protein kinase